VRVFTNCFPYEQSLTCTALDLQQSALKQMCSCIFRCLKPLLTSIDWTKNVDPLAAHFVFILLAIAKTLRAEIALIASFLQQLSSKCIHSLDCLRLAALRTLLLLFHFETGLTKGSSTSSARDLWYVDNFIAKLTHKLMADILVE
jgi:hypothetical protein